MDDTHDPVAKPPAASKAFAEWPTWLLAAAVYGGWGAAVSQAADLPWGLGHAALVFLC